MLARVPLLLVTLLGLSAPALAAQSAGRWSLSVDLHLARFGAAARDTTAAAAAEGTAGSLRPSTGAGLGLALGRRLGRWSAELGVAYLPASVEAATPVAALRSNTDRFDRARSALVVGREVGELGAGRLSVRAGPTLDTWFLPQMERRTVVGGVARVALAFPAGPVAWENVLGVTWSPGPIREEELPAGFARRMLVGVELGARVRFGL
jgi:hypothetical protein